MMGLSRRERIDLIEMFFSPLIHMFFIVGAFICLLFLSWIFMMVISFLIQGPAETQKLAIEMACDVRRHIWIVRVMTGSCE